MSDVAFADGTPEPSAAVRTDHGIVPPERIDPFTAFVAETLLPELRTRKGYRSLQVVVDRVSGDVRVTSSWSDRDTRRAASDAFLPVLRNAARFDLRPIAIEEP
jgi:hypothetical protein